MSVNYSERIPNNVGLSENRRLQRALEAWQPNYMRWWQELGPEGALDYDVYLRTAISVETDGWANFGYVKMPDYRWGIFLARPEEGGLSPLATTRASRPGKRCLENTAVPCAG